MPRVCLDLETILLELGLGILSLDRVSSFFGLGLGFQSWGFSRVSRFFGLGLGFLPFIVPCTKPLQSVSFTSRGGSGAMRVHPAPKKRSITARYGVNRSLSAAEAALGRQKKLRRLPHIFSKVLELPFGADADVSVHEDADGFQFVVAADGVGIDVRAHAIEIHPGVMKVVIRDGDEDDPELALDELELDRWRFRLPPSTRPALATAAYVDGELVVTVPKGPGSDDSGDEDGGEGNGNLSGGGIGQLVVVQ